MELLLPSMFQMNIIWFPILAILVISLKAQSDIQMPLVYDFVMSLGSSAPELTISVMSAIDGNPGTAIGNVIGSNIFNIFLVLGTSAVIRPLPFGGVSMLDLEVLSGSALMFWIFGWFFRQRTITRAEGGIMAACYVGYIAYLVIQAI